MPNLGELHARVSRATSGMFTDKYYMTDLINDAQNQLVDGARLRGVQAINIVAGTDTYPLPDNFKSPGTMIDAHDPNSILTYDLLDISENRHGYAIEGNNLIFKPVPQDNRVLTFYYYKYATLLAKPSDTPEIDSQYHDLLSFYAAGMILLLPQPQIQDKTLSDRYLNRWEEGKRSFIEAMQRKNKSSRARTVNNW